MAIAASLEGGGGRGQDAAYAALVNPKPIRLAGALAPAADATGGVSERIQVGGAAKVIIRARLTSGSGNISAFPMLSDAMRDTDRGGTRAGTRLPTWNGFALSTSELAFEYTPDGEQYMEIEVSGGIINYIEVCGQ